MGCVHLQAPRRAAPHVERRFRHRVDPMIAFANWSHSRRFLVPLGSFLNLFPPAFFLAVHLLAFLLGAFFAYRAFGGDASFLGWGFVLFAVAELVYMTYHLDWTVFLFSH